MTNTPDPLKTALELIAGGIPVFPCNPDKTPRVKAWQHAASLDPGQVTEWFNGTDALVAVPTGAASGIDLFDIDTKPGKDGLQTMDQQSWKAPITRTHRTPSDGWHLLYKHDPNAPFPTDQGVLGPGLDRRGNGGYMIWWPAHGVPVHPNGYAPQASAEWMRGKPKLDVSGLLRPITFFDAAAIYARKLEEIRELQPGEHNAGFHERAFVIGQLVQAQFYDSGQATADLRAAVAGWPDDSKTKRNIDYFIANSLKRGIESPGYIELQRAVLAAFGEPAKLATIPVKPAGLFISYDELIAQPPAGSWIIRGMLERATLNMIFGDSNAGKTFVALDWALSIACGVEWMGCKVTKGNVLYLNGEGKRKIGARVLAWQASRGVRPSGLDFVVTRRAVALNREVDTEALIADVERDAVRPDVVFVDTLKKAIPGSDERVGVDMGVLLRNCEKLQERWGCAVVFIHHTGHTNKERASGAYDIHAALDMEYHAKGRGRSKLTLEPTKVRDGAEPPSYAFVIDNTRISWFDPETLQPMSAGVLMLAPEAVESESPVAAGGGPIGAKMKVTDNHRLFWASLGDAPVSYREVKEAFYQGHGSEVIDTKRRVFERMMDVGRERGWYRVSESDAELLVPQPPAIERDRA